MELALRRIGAPGEPVPLDAIVRAGWPGDRAGGPSKVNRARVALTRLRKLGLGDLLVTQGGGHMLDPSVPIVVSRRDS
jgi:hypothetical protein